MKFQFRLLKKFWFVLFHARSIADVAYELEGKRHV